MAVKILKEAITVHAPKVIILFHMAVIAPVSCNILCFNVLNNLFIYTIKQSQPEIRLVKNDSHQQKQL